MTGPSWLVDSKRIAKKIKSASERDPRNIKWISNPTKACPRCNYVIDNTDVIQEWPGLPHGVKFDPTDQELLRHLVAKVGKSGVNPHPLINEFIPTVEEDDGICYTHPWKLPGVKQDGSVAHFFHRTFKAYNTGTRKRRKISADDHCDVRWHKTGKTKPVHLDGEHLGCKKIMVLYVSATKGSKPEKTNWVMHQYHLGTGEDEKDGEFVVSKIFYQQQLRPCDRKGELIFETADEVVGEFENVGCTGSATPDCHDENQNLIQTSEENSIQTKVGYDPVNDNNDINPELEGFATQNDADHHWSTKADNHGIPAPDSQPAEEPKWWEGESQFLLDSQQLADGIALCEEFLHSQSSCADEEGKSSRPCLSDYARMGVENLKRDLEECQNLSRDGDGRDLEECEKLSQDGDGNGSNIELDTALDMRLSQLDCGDGSNGLNIELDTASEMRLSQIEFGSQDSFMAWAEGKLV